MREIRTFELDHGEPATAWRVARPLTLQVMAGQVWLTVGQGGARLALAFASGASGARVRPAVETARMSLWSWVPRWLQTI
jgi:hypothetical protein